MILMAGLTVSIGSFWIFRSASQERSLLIYRVIVALFFFFMILHHTNLIGLNNRIDFTGWLFIYPLLVFFSLGSKAGIIWGSISLIAILASLFIQTPLLITESLIFNFKVQTLIALSGIGLIAYVYENVRQRTQEGLFEKHQALLESEKRLKESNAQIVREIAERKAAEEALTKMHNELELRVEERTAELTMEVEQHNQMEAAFLESEERYKALFDRSLDCVYVHDFQGNFIDANTAALNIFGIQREEIKSLDFRSMLDESQWPLAFLTLQELIEKGYQKNLTEFKFIKKNGEAIYMETIASTIYRRGEPYAVQGIARDITARKNAEEALYREKENFRKLVEESPFGVSLIGEEGEFQYVNPEFVSMFGYALEDLKKSPGSNRAFLEVNGFKELISDGYPTKTSPVVCKDGSEKLVETRSVRLESSEKIIFYEDISEKTGLEMRLRNAQKMEAIGTLAGGVAHDLNNILSGILSYPDLLLMDLPQDSPLRDPL
jgi:PAS domain S-box-containing protein